MADWYDRNWQRIADVSVTRRGFLGAALAGLIAACSGGDDSDPAASPTSAPTTSTSSAATSVPPSPSTPAAPAPRVDIASDPFTLGIASGDPDPEGFVLWTRLAPDPLRPGGGMPAADAAVAWDVAADAGMRDLVASDTAAAPAVFAHTVHVVVEGLEPGREYWYRFRVGDYESPVGRALTAPGSGSGADRLVIAHVSCSRYDGTLWAAYRDLAEARPDLIVHCGDYIYERASRSEVRADPVGTAIELDQYRAKYAMSRGDADLRAAHEAAPWLVTWDDHEVENNYTSDSPDSGSDTPDPEQFLARRAAAYQAWWEHMPVRLDPPEGADLPIYRTVRWGDLAAFHVLDTRQYRTNQICGSDGADIGPRCDASLDPSYTVLGDAQQRWLEDELGASSVAWSTLVQQVVVQQWRFAPGNVVWNLDQWDGYPAAREALLSALRASPGTKGTVVLTGDVHSSWTGSLAVDFDDPDSELVGTEFVAPGVGSPPNETLASVIPAIQEQSPHVAWANGDRRGWVLHEITPDRWEAQFRFVDDHTSAQSPITVGSEWSLTAGHRLQQQ